MHGKVTLIIRDKSSGDEIDRIEKSNIITHALYASLRGDYSSLYLKLFVTNAIISESRYGYFTPINGVNSIQISEKSSSIVGVNTPLVVGKTESSEAYVQFSGRWAAPSTGNTRTVTTIGVVSINASLTAGNNDNNRMIMAYTLLNTPCVQLDNQVIDIYYRIYFPYTAEKYNVPYFILEQRLSKLITATNIAANAINYYKFSPFPPLQIKPEDVSNIFIPAFMMWDDIRLTQILQQSSVSYYMGAMNNSLSFDYKVGNILCGVYSGSISSSYGQAISTSDFSTKFNKIQNVIGHGPESTNSLSTPWMDIDNLTTGTGKVYIEGEWDNRSVPSTSGMYFKTKLPEWNHILITQSGNIGASTYKYVTQKFFGNLTYNYPSRINSYTFHPLFGLCANTVAYDSYSAGKTLIGDMTQLTGVHIGASMPYDETSIIMVRPEKLILYSVASSNYWFITGNFTSIHQIAVVNGIIYIACKNTGLWEIDPRLTTIASKIDASAYGIDFTYCYGVAKGYNNTLWAVSNNSLSMFDGNTWTKYNENSSPNPFKFDTITGGNSTETWTNIEYLKVDVDSPTYQMCVIRKYGATYHSTSLGVWWSTETAATNMGNEPSGGNNYGRPRLNRSHVNGLAGFWVILRNSNFYRTTFNSTSYTSVVAHDGLPAFTSVNIIKDTSNTPLLICSTGTTIASSASVYEWYITAGNTNVTNIHIAAYSSNGTRIAQVTTTHGLSYLSIDPTSADITTLGSYAGYYDQTNTFILDSGVAVWINKYNTKLHTFVFNYGLDNTPHGGAMRDLVRTTYGWDGVNWIAGNANSKSTHLTAESLPNGITARFSGSTSSVFIDSSNTPKTISFNGNTKISQDQSKFNGYSAYFGDGIFNYLIVPGSTIALTGTYTIECYIYLASYRTVNQAIFYGEADTYCPVRIQITPSGKISIIGSSNNSTWLFTSGFESSTQLSTNTWTHIALVDDGVNCKLYVDGQLDATRTTWSRVSYTGNYNIGGCKNADRSLYGYIDEFRIKNTVEYSDTFAVPTESFVSDANTLLLLHMTPSENELNSTFVLNNYYKFGLCEGLMKDNATRASLFIPFHYKNVINSTTLSSNMVPALTTYSTGVVQAHATFKSNGATVNGSNVITFPGMNSRQYLVGDKMVTGDFTINYSTSNISQYVGFGIGVTNHSVKLGFIVTNSTTAYICVDGAVGNSGNTIHSGSTITSLAISRVGSTVTLLINNVVKYTSNDTQVSNTLPLYVVAMTKDVYDTNPSANSMTAPVTTIASNGSTNTVFVGNPNNNTGAFNSKFAWIDTYAPLLVTLNGIPAVVKTDFTSPSPGEVSINPYVGSLTFNNSDAGKTIAASFTYQVEGTE